MRFSGSIVALITPLFDDGKIDFPALAKLVDWHLQSATDALVVMGTTGESGTLEWDEHLSVVAAVVKQVNRRIPVIAGTGSSSTAKAVAMTKAVVEVGADATLCVTPYYVKPTQEGLYQHYRAVAAASDRPVILYNVPGRTCCDLQPETVARIAQICNVVGIKEATGNLERLAALKTLVADDFVLLSGDDETACEFMLRGGHGVITVTGNVAPAAFAAMCKAAIAGDRPQAEAIDTTLRGLHETLFIEPNPTPAKWACANIHGFSPFVRLPLLPLTEKNQQALRQAMQRAGVKV
jgi:4-hydroxy-tetrahydrodipicolinate synthase